MIQSISLCDVINFVLEPSLSARLCVTIAYMFYFFNKVAYPYSSLHGIGLSWTNILIDYFSYISNIFLITCYIDRIPNLCNL